MKILAPLLRYDYGDPRRGDSLERTLFVPYLRLYCEVVPLWLEDFGLFTDPDRLQREILLAAEANNPDFIFFALMRDEVWPRTLRLLAKRWRTVNWFADDLWRFESFTRNIAPLLSHCLTIDKFSLPAYHQIGCRKVFATQWGATLIDSSKDAQSYDYDVSFVGSWTSVRAWYVQAIKEAGIRVECFGSGWPNGRVGIDEMHRIVRRSKISLNLSNSQPSDVSYISHMTSQLLRSLFGRGKARKGYFEDMKHSLVAISNYIRSPKRVETIKARNFEIPAWGGFQLSFFCIGIEEFFVPGKEIVLFNAPWEMRKLVQYYLQNDVERECIRRAGMNRASEHTYEIRFGQIVEWLENETR